MISSALAAFTTLLIKRKPLSSLPWGLKKFSFLKIGYSIPLLLLYVSIAYFFIQVFGLADFINIEKITSWSKELGLEGANEGFIAVVMIFLLLTVGVIKNLGATLGEEIGWRGFLIFELKKVMSFNKLALISGVIWAVWLILSLT